MTKPMKTAALCVAAAVALTAAVVLVRTASFSSRQVSPASASDVRIDPRRVAEILSGGIRVQTVSHQDRPVERAILDAWGNFLSESFPRIHASLGREEVGAGSILLAWKGKEPSLPPVVLTGHFDVVPVEPGTEARWTHPPFEGRIADGYVWGRGALDDKSGVLCLLEAAESLLGQGFQPGRTIYLAFGHDEEVGGREGAKKIVERLRYAGVKPALVVDEGGVIAQGIMPGLEAPIALVQVGEKGYLSLELSAEVAGGHAGMPPKNTAVGLVSRAVTRIEDNPMPARLERPVRELFEHLGPEMSFLRKVVFANLWLFKPLVLRQLDGSPATNALIRTTAAPTMFQGSVKDNVLPARAWAVVNLRLLPGDSVAGATEHVRKVIDDPKVSVRAFGEPSEPPPVAETDTRAFGLIQRTVREVFPEALVAPSILVATSDARHYAGLTSAVYRFRPTRVGREDLPRYHGIDERVAVEDLGRAVVFWARFVRNTDHL